MSVIKRLGKSDAVRAILCWFGTQYIRLVHATSRFEVVNGDIPQHFWDEDKPFILAFWHGRLLMVPPAWRNGISVHILISQHRDGEFIARTVKPLGIDAIRGSARKKGKEKDKGGASALRIMVRTVSNGECIGITPDGPRGPRMRASDGVAAVAKLTGVPVLPFTYSVRSRRVLKSWDRFVLAWPFTRGVFIWGEPISVDRKADSAALDAARIAIETELIRITHEADRMMAHTPVEPDPAPAHQSPNRQPQEEVTHG